MLAAALVLLYTLPAFRTGFWAANKVYFVEPPFVALVVIAILAGPARTTRGTERRFWQLLAAAHASYLLAFVYLGEALEERWASGLLLLEDVSILMYYAAMFLALGMNPHLRSRSSVSGARLRIGSAGSVVFFFGLLVYFVLIPEALRTQDESFIPSMFLYLALDIGVLVALLRFRRRAGPRWRLLYGFLAANAVLWAALDGCEALLFAGAVTVPPHGTFLDLAWILPGLPVLAAARLRLAPALAGAADPAAASGRTHPPGGFAVPLVAYLALIPLLQFGLHWSGLLGPECRTYREVCTLVLLMVLGALALLDHRLQKAEQRRMGQQLRQTQKMEALGTLAGGIAHGFNNLLTVIIGQSQLLRLDLPADGPDRRRLEEVLNAGGRAKDLVQQILAFSRKSAPRQEVVDLAAVVREAAEIVRASSPPTVTLRQDAPASGLHVLADGTEMNQVVVNLCTNAVQAMEPGGGTLRIHLDRVEAGTDPAVADAGLPPGTYCRLRVSDTGHGMTPETAERIFDPFFTTKAAGQGTGLGLAVVYGIVSDAGGAITVDSMPGRGTTVSVCIPQAAAPAAAAPARDEPGRSGRGVVMVVDDETENADVLQHMLEWLGYDAVSFNSPLEALDTFRRQPADYDLVITDRFMPGMSGDTLAAELVRDRADIPVLLCTGLGDGPERDASRDAPIRHVLGKPVLLEDLSAAVEAAMHSGVR